LIPVIVDVETTGFSPEHAQVIQIAAIAICKRGHEEFNSYANPGAQHTFGQSAESAMEFNGITRGQVASAPSTDEVSYKFKEWIRMLEDRECDVVQYFAYNYQFDMRFLIKEPWCLDDSRWSAEDLMEMARQLLCNSDVGYATPNKPPKLSEAKAALDLRVPGMAHDALHDVRVSVLIFEEYGKFLREGL